MTTRDSQARTVARLSTQQRLSEDEVNELARATGTILKWLPKPDAADATHTRRWYGTTITRHLKTMPRHRVAADLIGRSAVNSPQTDRNARD
jgi:hypothetical protein